MVADTSLQAFKTQLDKQSNLIQVLSWFYLEQMIALHTSRDSFPSHSLLLNIQMLLDVSTR